MLNKRGLLEAYLSITCTFFIKQGSLRNGHNRKKGGGQDKKVVFAVEYTCTDIYACVTLWMYIIIYILAKILSRFFI